MDLITQESLAEELQLAAAYTPAALRDRLVAFLAFDQRLARIIAQSNEPMLAQIRIAWWRDRLAQPKPERPEGDAVLDAIGQHWAGAEAALIQLANGWEEMLADPPISPSAVERFLAARAEPFRELSPADERAHSYESVNQAARIWALADIAVNMSEPQERATIIAQGLDEMRAVKRLPKCWRGLAVLRSLAMRSLRAGGRPFMAGRGAAVAALWTGMTGR